MSAEGLDLLQAARSEDLKYNQIESLTVLGEFERSVVDTLKQTGAHLLIGARGVGKSMLFRRAEVELDNGFQENRKLGVYVNFKTSTLLEGVKAGERNAFQIWVGTKILQAIHEKLVMLNVLKPQDQTDPYRRIFGIQSVENTETFLKDKIHLLQKLAQASDQGQVLREIGQDFLDKVLDTTLIRSVLVEVASQYNIDKIVLLFDEAAHTFIPEQQEIFFEIFKMLHGDVVASKAAVYPSVTSYGRNFEIGQDAIAIYMDRFEPGEHGLRATRRLFRNILDLRLPAKGKARKDLFAHGELLDLCIDVSTGNPRAFLHVLNKAYASGFTERSITLAVQNFVDDELLPYHSNLTKRLPKFSGHVRTGLDILRNYIIPEIKEKNFREKKSGYESAFFTIPRDMSPNLRLALDLLCYSGILTAKGTVKIAERRTGLRYMVHLALLATEKAFAKSRLSESIAAVSLTDYREFSSSDPKIESHIKDLMEAGTHCRDCGAEVSYGAKFCDQCGVKIQKRSIVGALLEEPIGALSIGEALKNRIRVQYPKVGDVVQATKEELMSIKYVKESRARRIKNAAEEFISG